MINTLRDAKQFSNFPVSCLAAQVCEGNIQGYLYKYRKVAASVHSSVVVSRNVEDEGICGFSYPRVSEKL